MATIVFQKLQAWQDDQGVTDAALAGKIGVHQTAIWRAKRGLRVLGIEHQLALQKITGIPPAEWADFFAQTVHLRPSKAVKAKRAQSIKKNSGRSAVKGAAA